MRKLNHVRCTFGIRRLSTMSDELHALRAYVHILEGEIAQMKTQHIEELNRIRDEINEMPNAYASQCSFCDSMFMTGNIYGDSCGMACIACNREICRDCIEERVQAVCILCEDWYCEACHVAHA